MADVEAHMTAAAATEQEEHMAQETGEQQPQKDTETVVASRRSKLDLSREKMEAFKKRAEKRGVVRLSLNL